MNENPSQKKRIQTTTIMVVLALLGIGFLFFRYYYRPWTRDGQVRSHVIQVTPEVNGKIIGNVVRNNQSVKKGDILFEIEPTIYEQRVKAAQAKLNSQKVSLIEKQEQYQRRNRARQSITREQLTNARHAFEIAQARLQGAEADLALAQWELEHTQVIAPVDGHVTNVQIHRGSYARGGHAALALVDANSYWISAHFKETSLKKIKKGAKAKVRLMGYRHKPMEGVVDSIGWGIDNSDGNSLPGGLPRVDATFDWIRLAQRVPVKIIIPDPPKDIALVVGTTCSVTVYPKR